MNEHGHGRYMECFIKGIRVLEKYMDEDELKNHYFSADHDIIYLGVPPEKVSDEDKQLLDELGFHEENHHECWGWFT